MNCFLPFSDYLPAARICKPFFLSALGFSLADGVFLCLFWFQCPFSLGCEDTSSAVVMCFLKWTNLAVLSTIRIFTLARGHQERYLPVVRGILFTITARRALNLSAIRLSNGNHMKTLIRSILWTVLAFGSTEPFICNGQVPFQNLLFESADVAASPKEFYPNFVNIGSALPGWTAYLGSEQVTQVGYNAPANSTASITLIGPAWSSTDVGMYGGVGIINGNYSVDLQTGANPLNPTPSTMDASIAQNGTVPSTAESLQFKAFETTPLTVSFNGNSLAPVALSSGVSSDGVPYTLYGANISAWDGQTGELQFTADFNGSYNFVMLDDITFSTEVVSPEPGIVALTANGGLLFGVRKWFARR
jgi:hypothetical protein